MKDPLEEALEKLKPAEMPNDLMARLTALRPQPAKAPLWERLSRKWLLPVVAGACAGVVALTWLRNSDDPKPVTGPQLAHVAPIPFERSDYLVGARDVGVVVAPNQQPYRVIEVEWLEEDTIRASERGPGVRVETKRREIIPVRLEVF